MKKILIIILCIFSLGCSKAEVKNVNENNIKQEIKQIEKNNYVSYNGNLHVDGKYLVNQYGEKVLLKGISSHGIQWYSNYVNEDVLKTLKDEWNTNVFRIAMYTKEGGYIDDKSIEDKVKEIVDIATKLDMYVIIDWHILSDNNPNTYKDEAIKFFKETAETYKDNKNVIYEICNEPNGNTSWEDIKRYANEVIPEIRKIDSDSVILVGTPNWSQYVDKAADSPLDFDNIMYVLHFYSGTHKEWLREKMDYAISKDLPIFVSEFGTTNADGNGGVYKDETIKWINYLKENNISFINWSLSDKNESSALLLPGTDTHKITDNDLSESGKIIKSIMLEE